MSARAVTPLPQLPAPVPFATSVHSCRRWSRRRSPWHGCGDCDGGTTGRRSDGHEQGTRIVGVMTPDKLSVEPGSLGYGRTYTVTVTGVGTNGAVTTHVINVLDTNSQQPTRFFLRPPPVARCRRCTYGIGTVVVAHFDEPIQIARRRTSPVHHHIANRSGVVVLA